MNEEKINEKKYYGVAYDKAVEKFGQHCLSKYDIAFLQKCNIHIEKDTANPVCIIDKAWVCTLKEV